MVNKKEKSGCHGSSVPPFSNLGTADNTAAEVSGYRSNSWRCVADPPRKRCQDLAVPLKNTLILATSVTVKVVLVGECMVVEWWRSAWQWKTAQAVHNSQSDTRLSAASRPAAGTRHSFKQICADGISYMASPTPLKDWRRGLLFISE